MCAAATVCALTGATRPAQAQKQHHIEIEDDDAETPPVQPERPPPKSVRPPEREGPRPCDASFFKPCPDGFACIDNECRPQKKVPPPPPLRVPAITTPDAARSSSTASDRVVVVRERFYDTRPFRLGVSSGFLFGFSGKLENPRPGFSIIGDFGVPVGRAMRWHLELGYEDLNGATGFRINPLVFGYSIPFYDGPVQLEAEVIAAILQSEILFNDGFSVAASSGLRGQIVMVYGIGYVALAPLGVEVRYAYGLQNIGITTGSGLNWPLLLTLGLEL